MLILVGTGCSQKKSSSTLTRFNGRLGTLKSMKIIEKSCCVSCWPFRCPHSCFVGFFCSFWGAPSSYFRFIFDDFRGSAAHVRIGLSLQSQHDLEASWVSKNRRFFHVVFGREQKCISEHTFMICVRFLGGEGSHLEAQMASK